MRLPDFPFPHSDPDGFSSTSDIVRYIEAYADFVSLPIRCGVAVTRLSQRDGGGFIAETADGAIAADNVVVATGPYQRDLVPDLLRRSSRIPGPCRRLQEIPNSFRRARCWSPAPARRARRLPRNCCRPAAASTLGRATPPPAAPLPRPRPDLVARRDAPRSDHAGGARPGAIEPGHFRRLWRPHHRLPQLRRRRHRSWLGRIEAAHDGVLEIAPGLAENLSNGDLVYDTFLNTVDDAM